MGQGWGWDGTDVAGTVVMGTRCDGYCLRAALC